MKKSKLLFIASSVMVALGLGLSVAHHGVQKAEAATFVDQVISDDFATGIDAEQYDVIDSESKVGLVERNGVLRFGKFDFNVGYLHNAELIERGTKSVVFQFNQLTPHAGYMCPTFSNGYSWPNMIMASLHTAVALPNGGGDTATYPVAQGTLQWFAGKDNPVLRVRIVWNDNGSAYISVSQDSGASFLEVMNWPASTYAMPESGYVGFYGNGMTDTVDLDSVKIGVADDADLTNLEWLVEDEFETANDGNFVLDSVMNPQLVTYEQLGGMSAVLVDNPASGAGIVSKAAYTLQENADVLFSAKLHLELTELGAKAVGLGFGLDADATAADSALLVGVREVESQKQLVLLNNGELVKKVDLASLANNFVLNVTVERDGQAFKVVASIGNDVLEQGSVENAGGRLAIAVSGEGSTAAKVLGLEVTKYRGALEKGRNISIGESFDHNWLVSNGASGSVTMDETGLIHFQSGNGDDTRIQTRHRYANFDLKFDAQFQQLDEDAEPVIPASKWLGISMGRNTLEDAYWADNTEMLYIQADTIDSIHTQDGYMNGVATPRGWLTTEYFPLAEANKDVVFTYHLTAHNGEVRFAISKDDAPELEVIIWKGMKTDGYIAFSGTSGTNCFIKNVILVNTDGVVDANNAPVAQDATLSVYKGATGNGQLVATDADEYDAAYLKYELVEDNTADIGALTLNADGSYSFAASAVGEATFTYKVSDTESYSEVKTVTITVSEDPLVVAKANAKAELEGYKNAADYREAEAAQLATIVTNGKAAIDAATDEAGVASELASAKALADALKTKAQYEAEEAQPQPGPADGGEQGGQEQPAPAKKGCGSSIVAASAIISVVTLLGVGLLLKRKEK